MRSVLVWLAMTGAAVAHSWYPHECCSDRDCYPVAVERVKAVAGGWLVEDRDFIAFAQARPSPDGRFHICRYDDGRGGLITIPGKPACFWAPVGAS